jgi:peptidyl-prolyl cis-trans isomerase SurA
MILRSVFAFVLLFALYQPVNAQEASVIATVNDRPVTTFDIDQRIKLLRILGQNGDLDRKKIGNALIDDVVKIDEARRYKIDPTEKEIDERLGGMAKGLKTDMIGLEGKLGKQGLTLNTMRQYIAAQMSFSRLLSARYKEKIAVDPGDVDKKMAEVKADIDGKVKKIMADPRRQPIEVYSILQIDFPVEGGDPQLLQSRAIEVGQYLQKFKGCGSARAAAAGIFNVKVGKQIDADGRKLPAPLKAALDAKGVGRAIGPVRGPKGVQAIAWCGKRTIVPPKINAPLPTRQQIENMALNEKFDRVEQKYLAIMRKGAVIEYKDQSFAK